MNEVLAIAGSVCRRILKMKVVYFLVACAIVEISVTTLYEILMMQEHRMLMVDLALLLTTLSGLLVVISLAFDIPKEMRDGGAAIILSKPISRAQYLVGKFLGISTVGVLVTTAISAGFCAVHYHYFEALPPSAVWGHILAVSSIIPMAAIALLFSSLLNEAAAAIFTAVAVWLAHSTPVLVDWPVLYGGLIPDLNLFNLRAEATHNIEFGLTYVGLAALWGIVYSIALISLTGLLFNLKDLK